MRRFAIIALAAAAAASAPAAAQIAGKRDYGPVPVSSPFPADSRLPGPGIGREMSDLEGRIEKARESGALSRGEARRLEREARAIGRLARRYGRDGLSPSERSELENRAAYLRDSVGRPRPERRALTFEAAPRSRRRPKLESPRKVPPDRVRGGRAGPSAAGCPCFPGG